MTAARMPDSGSRREGRVSGCSGDVDMATMLQVKVNFKSMAPPPDASMTISEAARRSGVAASALRFYESQGLIHAERAASGQRRFSRAVLRRVAFIVFAQRIGLSLDEITRELAQLPANRVPERADWARLSARWTSRVDQRMEELQRLRDGLTTCIGCGCLSLGQCALANPDDRAGRLGPGPRYWVARKA